MDPIEKIKAEQHGIIQGDRDINVLCIVDRTLPVRITTDSGEVTCQIQFLRKFTSILARGGDTVKACALI